MTNHMDEWRFTDDGPMFVSRNEMEKKGEIFEREVQDAADSHEHYLMAIVGYRVPVTALGDRFTLELSPENLRIAPNIGCFICETAYTREMDPRCPGEPVH